jgi:hypothetical protein
MHRVEFDIGHTLTTAKRATELRASKLARIAAHLRWNAEDLASSTIPPTPENCRIAGAMLNWAFRLTPIRVGNTFDY